MSLAARFRAIGLTAEEMRETPARHAALREDPAAGALRLFRDHAVLTPDELGRVFGDTGSPSGLVIDGQALYRLEIIEGLYLLSDWPSPEADEVLPAGETTAILHRAARALCNLEDTSLDLGCGSGTLALLLARDVAFSVGTDVNPRAITLARMNAEINGIGNVDFRVGSLWEPVAGERFDIVVSQPPYVPRPPGVAQHVFLHGGTRGDELARAILDGMAGHLRDGGRGLVFSDWPLTKVEQLRERITAPGLRARLFASPPLSIESYARSYGEGTDGPFRRHGNRERTAMPDPLRCGRWHQRARDFAA